MVEEVVEVPKNMAACIMAASLLGFLLFFEDAALPAERVGESGRLIAHLCAQAERAPEGADHDAVSEERVDEDGEGGGDDAGRPRSSQLDEGARLGVIGAEFAATTHQGRGRSATGQRRRPDCRCPRR